MSTIEDELVGQVLGSRYRVVRLIGRGGMGSVYEALDVDLGRRVALKAMLPELSRDPVLLERFRREVRNTARLTHPNVVQVTDYGRASGEPPFLVMELLEGRTLVARLKKGRLEPRRAVRITLQVLSALAAAHEAGVVHRDLKPENVFLIGLDGGLELVKLLDFGLAKLMDDEAFGRLTRTGVLVGTPRYAAPEQVKGSRNVDARTDVYAAGVLLYAMITGRPPFLTQPPQLWTDLLQKDPTSPRVVVPTLPPELVEVVQKAMSKRPADRYPSARAMSEALSAFLVGARSPRSTLPAELQVSRAHSIAPAAAAARTAAAAPRFPHLVPALVGVAMLLAIGAVLAGVTLAWALYTSDPSTEVSPEPPPAAPLPAPPPPAPPLAPPTTTRTAPTTIPTPSPVTPTPARPAPPTPARPMDPGPPSPSILVPPSVALGDPCADYQRRACDCPSRPALCGEAQRNVDSWRGMGSRDPDWLRRACASALSDAESQCVARTIDPWPAPRPIRPVPF